MYVVTQLYFQIVEENKHVSALFWVGHHQAETRISEKTHILQCGHQEWGTRSRFTMFGEVCSYICAMWNLRWLRLCLSCPLYVHRHVGWSRLWKLFWSVLSWLGRLHRWWLWRRQLGLWSNCLQKGGGGRLDKWMSLSLIQVVYLITWIMRHKTYMVSQVAQSV
jgi:hypothetical protein